MARIYPDSEKTRVIFSSSAEEQFYEQCKAQLPDEWRVWHSRTLSTMDGAEGLRDNEIDFVCYHPRYGVLVVEVKGGRIRFDAAAGGWFSINRHGESFGIKDPFQQALLWKSRFVRYLRQNHVKVPVSYAVCFPTASEDEFPESAGTTHELIIGRNRLKNLGKALSDIAVKSQPEQYLNFADVGGDLDRLLAGASFMTRLFLRDYLDSHDGRVKDIESIHETLITPIASSRRLGIEGEAGTGKTMLAVMLARHFRDQGRKVLLLGSNALLNLLLQRDLGDGIAVKTYAELGNSYGVNLLIPPADWTGSREDWVQFEAPERIKRAIAAGSERHEVLICDEAQDVQPFWWEAFESLLDWNNPESRIYLFFDSSQGVFGGGVDLAFNAKDVLPIPAPYFPLVHNYRTTREIATFARAFRTQDTVLASHSGRLGYLPEIIVYKDADDARRQLAALTKRLVHDEGLSSTEITLLSARNPVSRESVLYQTDELAKMPLYRMTSANKKTWRDASVPNGSLGVSTIAGFKGMETPVGILINVSEYNLPVTNPIMSSLIYVACSRAKHMLYVFLKEGDQKIEAFRAALDSIKATGTMVVTGTRRDFEFAGKVTHYDPERVGWLTVDDPAFEQGSIMFFPHDVKLAGLKDVKVGARLKFRPRVDGVVTIASDLVHVQAG